jgi:hypothetical protein
MPIYEYQGQQYDLPDGLSNEQAKAKIEAYISKGATQPQEQPQQQQYSGFLMGLKDPLSGGAQLLEKALPQPLVDKINKLNNELAKYGLVSPVGAGGVNEMVAKEQQAYEKQRQAAGDTGMDLSRIAGNVLSPANLAMGYMGGPVAAGAMQGALTPTTGGQDFAGEKATQIAAGAVGGKLGEAATAAVGKALSPVMSKYEQEVRKLGVTPTMGQTLGGGAKVAEDFGQKVPFLGEFVRNARERTLYDFNKGVINKALSKIDDKLPAEVIGRDAVSYAADQVSNAYDNVLSKMSFNLDFKTTSGILEALNKANLPTEAQRTEATNVLNKVALERFNKTELTGAEYKAIESDLRKEASSYLNSASNSERKIGEALNNVLKVFKTELADQNPKYTSKLRRIDSAYGDLSVMERAAAATGSANGVFTPEAYKSAVRAADVTRNKRAYARGLAREQGTAEAAQAVLGKGSDSMVEGRLGLQQLGGAAASLALSPVASLAYTKEGQKIMDAILRERPELAKQIGQELQQAAPLAGRLFGAPTIEDIYRR